LEDYRSLNETFDAIYSIGIFQHLGARNYATHFETARKCLNPQGRFLLHTIGDQHAGPHLDPWVGRYIFPNGHIPSAAETTHSAEPHFIIED
jgi:cyclopropane-fatty-acyl-phospholipid synthase